MELDMIFQFPLIECELLHNYKHYKGILSAKYKDYEIHVVEKMGSQGPIYKLKTKFPAENDLSLLKTGIFTNIVDFLNTLQMCLEDSPQNIPLKNLTPVYKSFIWEFNEFSNFYLSLETCKLDLDLGIVSITTRDESGRLHALEITVNLLDPEKLYGIGNVTLPAIFKSELQDHVTSLNEIYSTFVAMVNQLQDLFAILDELDDKCYILDPEIPQKQDCHRRIWISQSCSVLLVFDPKYPSGRPDIKFFGPEKLVEKYRQNLIDALHKWEEFPGVIPGLLEILEIDSFPAKPARNESILVDVGDCSICFSLRCENNFPDVFCGNESCEKMYHTECLYQWLVSVSSRRIHDRLHGSCPNCEKGISCQIPDTAEQQILQS